MVIQKINDGSELVDLSILTISRDFEVLNKLLNSINNNKHDLKIEVLCSWNGDKEIIKNRDTKFNFPFEVHFNKEYSFAKNNNDLANKAKGEVLLFVNDDVILDKDSLQTAWNAFQSNKVGIVGINLRYPNNKIQHAGVYFREDGSSYHRFKHKVNYKDTRFTKNMVVPAVTGAFIMMERKEFLQLKFDEKFRVAGEDLVLCLEYQKKFHKDVLYVGTATAIHAENVTRRKVGTRLTPPEDLEKIKIAYCSCKEKINSITDNYKVRIVTESSGWILHRMALEIKSKIKNVWINQDVSDADIHYYINYGYFNKKPSTGITIANFTHYDSKLHNEKFIKVAEEVEHCISISKETTKVLKNFGVNENKISTVITGADTSFKPKLTLGIVGRTYPNGRKGEHLIKGLLEDKKLMQNLQIVSLNEGWGVPVWNLKHADFYRSIDFLLIPSLIEGGPVPFMEALACGTLSIAPSIGVIPQFPHIEYDTGNIESLKNTIARVKNSSLDRKQKIADYIKDYNWEGWATMHDRIFKKLLFDLD